MKRLGDWFTRNFLDVEKTNPSEQGLKPLSVDAASVGGSVEKTNPSEQGLKPKTNTVIIFNECVEKTNPSEQGLKLIQFIQLVLS